MKVTALAGGTGAAKLIRGLAACVGPANLTVVGNTGDDTEVWGLHVSPDLDTVLYALAGLLDGARGWGRTSETFHCLETMTTLGEEGWFRLGDRDLALHLHRTRALEGGRRLSSVTADFTQALGVTARILPMSDDPVRTRVRTPEGWLAFQEYFVREHARVKVLDVAYDGAEQASAGPGVTGAIAGADVVVLCPSNPVSSIGPILAVPGIVSALATTRAPVIGVSPIVGGAAVSGPAADLMRARGLSVSGAGVASAYAPWLGALVLDRSDAAEAGDVEALGVRAILDDVIMSDATREIVLAQRVLEAART